MHSSHLGAELCSRRAVPPHGHPTPASSHSDKQNGSFVLFGGIEDAHLTGNRSWIPLTAQTYWQIKVDR